MMRTRLLSAAMVGFMMFTAVSVFANTPRRTDDENKPVSTVTAAANDSNASPATTPGDSPADTPPAPAPADPQGSGGNSAVDPMAATTGTLGLFTLETGQTLTKGSWSSSADLNKFTRMPGSVSVLQIGVNFGYGITDRLNFYANFDPYGHTHIGLPTELSLLTPSNNGTLFPEFGSTIYRRLGPNHRPGYVEDYPFAANDNGGVGDLTLGLKLGLWSEDRGAPFSFSVRNDFIIPTVTNLSDLLANGTQTGAFDDLVSFALSKNWSNAITVTGNAGFEFTTDPTSGGVVLFHQADQIHAGFGFILFPQSRFEIMSEYNAVVFTGLHTPDMTFGARDPVDGVWGVRLNLNKAIAVDAGYRYMLNLSNANDRSGFIVKIGTTHFPEPPPVKANQSPVVSCSADKASVFA